MSHHTPPHPYTHILSDCLSVIFSYHIHRISHDYTHYSHQDLAFFRKFIVCWRFEREVHVQAFLEQTRGKKLKLQYVCARASSTLNDETCKLFRGIRELDIAGCNITDAALENLRGIETLDIGRCRTISSDAFVNLRGVRKLSILCMKQLTDAVLVHLRGIQHLYMPLCTGVTDAGIVNLRGIQSLDMRACDKLTDACFENLRGIQELVFDQNTITTAVFPNLRGIRVLKMSDCAQISGSAFQNLIGIHELDMSFCTQISDDHLQYLVGVKRLNISDCTQITAKGLQYIRGVEVIEMDNTGLAAVNNLAALREARYVVTSLPATEHVLQNLRRARRMCLHESTISYDGVFSNLANLEELELYMTDIRHVTDDAFRHLRNLRRLTLWNFRGVGKLTKHLLENLFGQLESFRIIGRLIHLEEKDVDDVVHWLSQTKVFHVKSAGKKWDKAFEKWKVVRNDQESVTMERIGVVLRFQPL